MTYISAQTFSSPKSYRLIFASHSFAGSSSDLNKDNLGLYAGESVLDKYQNFPYNSASAALGAWGKSRSMDLQAGGNGGSNPLHHGVISVSLKVIFEDVLSVLTRDSNLGCGQMIQWALLVQHVVDFVKQ